MFFRMFGILACGQFKICRAFAVYQTRSALIRFECAHVIYVYWWVSIVLWFVFMSYLWFDFSQVLSNDFFLVACLDDFIENARLFIFETFCRIHQCISIKWVSVFVSYYCAMVCLCERECLCVCHGIAVSNFRSDISLWWILYRACVGILNKEIIPCSLICCGLA